MAFPAVAEASLLEPPSCQVPGEAVVRLGGKKCERSPASGALPGLSGFRGARSRVEGLELAA